MVKPVLPGIIFSEFEGIFAGLKITRAGLR